MSEPWQYLPKPGSQHLDDNDEDKDLSYNPNVVRAFKQELDYGWRVGEQIPDNDKGANYVYDEIHVWSECGVFCSCVYRRRAAETEVTRRACLSAISV